MRARDSGTQHTTLCASAKHSVNETPRRDGACTARGGAPPPEGVKRDEAHEGPSGAVSLSREHVLKGARPGRRSVLPNILVYIDIREGRPTVPTLFALSEARRISRLAGASTFAVVVTTPLTTEQLESLAAPIAAAGADKLLLCEADECTEPPQDATHGRALDAAAARVPPMLVLFPAGGAGVSLGPALAARLGGTFAPWSDLLTTEAEVPAPDGAGRVQVVHLRPDGRTRRRLDPMEIERPIVATLGAGRPPRPSGTLRDLEVEVLSNVRPTDGALPAELERVPSAFAHVELATVLVLIADGADGEPLLPPAEVGLDAPVGTVVARAARVPPGVLTACCPDVLLKIGASPAQTARSPRTRVVLVGVGGESDPAPEEIDVLWSVNAATDLTVDVVRALLAEIGGHA